ncbi:ABC transporter ATP-binding protein [Patulibacter defluvii]|uniref:ABC transporter ATP-binding protein n=1 Tax=Patulibacter defluvii TaxID=3095358 RepID=UPI002A765B12|nr:ABC transporter ATP-binding protein [Patulibacter sp. DM4]
MIAIEDITVRYGATVAVADVRLEVATGEVLALLGPSGCGKTTLLRTIAGLERPAAGAIALGERVVVDERTWVAPERRRVGIVFQDYALFPHLDVAGNVGYGLARRERRERVAAVLERVGLRGLEHRRPHELSGGQQQRVALARALAPEPEVVLLDEPWAAVDAQLRVELREELVAILRAQAATVVLVTHEREEALALADRVAVLRDGRLEQVAAPEQLYAEPADRWVAEFVGACNFVPGELAGERVETPLGALRASAARRRPDGAVDVLVRPEALVLHVDPGGAGRILDRQFHGHDVAYRVGLDDGTVLLCQRPSTEAVALGDRVRVAVDDRAVPTFARAA